MENWAVAEASFSEKLSVLRLWHSLGKDGGGKGREQEFRKYV